MSQTAIPEPFKWNKDFQVFYNKLDEEHQGLFDGIFNCENHREDKNAYKTLHDRIIAHFQHEEDCMDDANHECSEHKDNHKDFVKTLKAMSVPLSDENIRYAKRWLVEHISKTDFKYKGQLNCRHDGN